MLLTRRFLIVVATAAVISLTGMATANHVDFVVDGGFFVSTDAPNSPAMVSQMGDGGNIIGAERDVMVSTNAGFVSAGTVNAPMGPGPVGPNAASWLLFSNSVGSSGQLMLTYDGAGTSGLGGLNFDTAWDRLAVDFTDVQGSGDVSVQVRDLGGNSGSVTQSVSSPGIYSYNFTDGGYAGVDFTSVDSIKLTIDTTTPASDFGLNAITRETIVPEPTTATLLFLAVGMIGLGRRR